MPPPAEGFAVRFVLGPALRTQPDRRLVALVRDGYELAFEEIVRRYGRPLTRYAAAIVGGQADDVTQDAFSKALLALRRDGTEIELRSWLFRIVRNTALNELRDNPPSAEALAEAIASGRNPAEEVERREELTDLMRRLQSLPEPQRAAIVMRELEGLSHEEIATALGMSGGGARQAIYRARRALREGLGVLLPLPLLRLLIDHGSEAAAVGASAGGAAAVSGAAGGASAGMALKAGVVTAVLAGSVGTGIALHDRGHVDGDASAATTPTAPNGASAAPVASARGPGPDALGADRDHSRPGHNGDDHGEGGSSEGPSGNDNQVGFQQALTSSGNGTGPSPTADEHHGRHGPEEGDDHGGSRGPRPDGRGEHRGGGDSHSGPGPEGGRPANEHSGGGRGGEGGSGGAGGGGGDPGRRPGGEGSGSSGLVPPPEEEPRSDEEEPGSEGPDTSGRNDELP